MCLQGVGREKDCEVYILLAAEESVTAFCVFLGRPLPFSGSQLSTFSNEQLEELFPKFLSAEECSSALFFSVLLRPSLKRVFPQGKCFKGENMSGMCYPWLPLGQFRAKEIVKDGKGGEEESR